ncbi:MAG: VWA domain-containing protein [Simkaniaceae bacterium]|nr:VWA domain-containing protein [Simkaniaceae bacterium]
MKLSGSPLIHVLLALGLSTHFSIYSEELIQIDLPQNISHKIALKIRDSIDTAFVQQSSIETAILPLKDLFDLIVLAPSSQEISTLLHNVEETSKHLRLIPNNKITISSPIELINIALSKSRVSFSQADIPNHLSDSIYEWRLDSFKNEEKIAPHHEEQEFVPNVENLYSSLPFNSASNIAIFLYNFMRIDPSASTDFAVIHANQFPSHDESPSITLAKQVNEPILTFSSSSVNPLKDVSQAQIKTYPYPSLTFQSPLTSVDPQKQEDSFNDQMEFSQPSHAVNPKQTLSSDVSFQRTKHPFFTVSLYDENLDHIDLPSSISHEKAAANSNFSQIQVHSPRLKSRFPKHYYNAYALLNSLDPEEEEDQIHSIPLTYNAQIKNETLPARALHFDSLTQSALPSDSDVEIQSDITFPKSDHLIASQIDIPLIAPAIKLAAQKGKKELKSHFKPKEEEKNPQSEISSQRKLLMLEALKYLQPHLAETSVFSFDQIKANPPLLVNKEGINQKVELPPASSLILPTESVHNEAHIDLKPIDWRKHFALQEEIRENGDFIVENHPLQLFVESFSENHILFREPSEEFPIFGFEEPLFNAGDVKEEVKEECNQTHFAQQYDHRTQALNTYAPTFRFLSIERFNLPTYHVAVKSASSENAFQTLYADQYRNVSEDIAQLKLATHGALHIFSAHDFKYLAMPGEQPDLLREIEDLVPDKVSLQMRNNPAHTLSFIHKINLPKHRNYALEFKKPLTHKFHLSTESHQRDLIHSSQIITSLPSYGMQESNFIGLLDQNENQFIPDVSDVFISGQFDFSPLFKRVFDLVRDKQQKYAHKSTLPSLYELNTQILSTEFKTDVEVIAKPNKKGYFFSLKLSPFFPEELRRIRQNIFFVMDQCRSINKERFIAFKKAILRALPYLDPDDTFNVIAFDNHFEKLSGVNLFYSSDAHEKTKRFLENVSYGSLASPQDYSKIISYLADTFNPDPQEVNVIVLLTDGAAYKTHHLQKDKVDHFTKVNQDRFSIYTISASQHNYLSALDLMSFLNRGSMLHSKSHAALPRQLALMIKKMRYPIATNLHLTLINSTSPNVKFYPGSGHFENFYGHKPFVIYGEADSLCEFDVMIQGKAEDEWINITQSVNLQQALPGDRELLRDATLVENKTHNFSENPSEPDSYDLPEYQ